MVKRAIIMAAGYGSRMAPITDTTPKPLVKVNGVSFIETMIEALHEAGVNEIYVVIGYKAEQFSQLCLQYPTVTLIENKAYEVKNNISTVYAAIDILRQGDCYICEGDLLVNDPTILNVDSEKSSYLTIFSKENTTEWSFKVRGARITEIIPSKNTYQKDIYTLIGVSYWTKSDARTLADKLELVYHEEGHEQLYFDEVVNKILGDTEVYIKEVEASQIIEVDTFQELCQLDASYILNK